MAVKAQALGPGTLDIGETGTLQSFASQITNAVLEPSFDAEDNITVLSGEEVAGEETESWVLKGTFLQEYGVGNLLQWCFDNSGTELVFTFKPRTDGALEATGNLVVRAVAVGGDVKTKNTAEFEFKLVGRPVITTAA